MSITASSVRTAMRTAPARPSRNGDQSAAGSWTNASWNWSARTDSNARSASESGMAGLAGIGPVPKAEGRLTEYYHLGGNGTAPRTPVARTGRFDRHVVAGYRNSIPWRCEPPMSEPRSEDLELLAAFKAGSESAAREL